MEQPPKYAAIATLRSWYARHERPISSLSLIGGFVFDAITLKRVDMFWDNFWVIVHLLVVGICIILLNREENEGAGAIASDSDPAKLHFWLLNILQFFFGGLISTFIVFYFRSAVLAVAWPFFLILALAFVANESFKRHYARIDFQISFFFLSVYLFAIFLLPVLLHQISSAIFLASGGVSLIILLGFLGLLKLFTKEGFKRGKNALLSSVVGIYIVVNALYFLNLIPPLPLSLRDAGIYHSIARNASDQYVVTEEAGSIWDRFLTFLDIYPAYHAAPGSAVYAYSAIFSPIAFNTNIVHEWQRYDAAKKKWVTAITIPLGVVGGREQGYRTYSINTGLSAGKWRVNVKTPSGQLVGRMIFSVVIDGAVPVLATETKS